MAHVNLTVRTATLCGLYGLVHSEVRRADGLSSRCDVQHYGAVQFLTGFTILYFYPAVPCWAASDENMAAWWCLPPTLITVPE